MKTTIKKREKYNNDLSKYCNPALSTPNETATVWMKLIAVNPGS